MLVLVQKASAVVMVVPLLVPMRVLVPVLMDVLLHINLCTYSHIYINIYTYIHINIYTYTTYTMRRNPMVIFRCMHMDALANDGTWLHFSMDAYGCPW